MHYQASYHWGQLKLSPGELWEPVKKIRLSQSYPTHGPRGCAIYLPRFIRHWLRAAPGVGWGVLIPWHSHLPHGQAERALRQRNVQLVGRRRLVCTEMVRARMLKWTPSFPGMNEEVRNTKSRREKGGFTPALPHSFLQVSTWGVGQACVLVWRAFE